MIEIKESVRLRADPESVWAVLSDPYEVVSCLPDAEILSENEDGTYKGRIVIRFGPMRVHFVAQVALEWDEPKLEGRMTARGQDAHGGTRMKTVADFNVRSDPADGNTVVNLDGSVDLSGRLAGQIEAAAGSVVRNMSGDFVEALARRLGEPDVEFDAGHSAAGNWLSRYVERISTWLRGITGWRRRRR